MGRAKAGMELITNKKSRRLTFEKRRKGLDKKAHELSTLCGIKLGLIIYGPKDTDRPNEPHIWPNNHQEIHNLIKAYMEDSAEDRRRRTTDLSTFYKDRTKKAEDEFIKLHMKNIESKHPAWDERFDNLTFEELKQFGQLLETKIQAMEARLESMKLEIYPPHPVASFSGLPEYGGGDLHFHKSFNSFSAHATGNQPKTMMMMNDDGSSSIIPASYNNPAVAGGYYFPVQPMPVFVQYPLQSRSSAQIQKAQIEEYYGIGDFQYTNQK